MEYISIFNGNPTAGARDGAEVSQNGVLSNPVSADVEIDAVSGTVVTCAIRCQSGYEADGNVTITSGLSNVTVSLDGQNWSDSIDVSGVDDTNTLFYVQIEPGANLGTETGVLELAGTVVAA